MAEARAYAWVGLPARGRVPLAVGAAAVAANSCRAVRNGRSVGSRRPSGRGAMGVYNRKAQRLCGFTVVGLDSKAEVPSEPSLRGAWPGRVAGDNRVTPADGACFRDDFGRRLGSLPVRKRRIAELPAGGYEGVAVARLARIS